MALSSGKGGLHIGAFEINTTTAQFRCGQIVGILNRIEQNLVRIAGPKGTLSPKLAEAAVVHVRTAVATGGKNLPSYGAYDFDVTARWQKIKDQYERATGPHILTGSLMDSVKTLYRRTKAGGRQTVVGIDQRKTVPVINYGGLQPQRIKVSFYAASLEHGWASDKPRPLLTLAYGDFVRRQATKLTRVVVASYAKSHGKLISETTKEAKKFHGLALDAAVGALEAGVKDVGGSINLGGDSGHNRAMDRNQTREADRALVFEMRRLNPFASEMEISRARAIINSVNDEGYV